MLPHAIAAALAKGQTAFGSDISSQNAMAARADAAHQVARLQLLARAAGDSPLGMKLATASAAWQKVVATLSGGSEPAQAAAEKAAARAEAALAKR